MVRYITYHVVNVLFLFTHKLTQTEREREREREKQTDRQTNKQTDLQTDYLAPC